MMDYTAKAAIMVAADPNTCYDAFAKPDRMTRFWFPRVSAPIESGAALKWYVGVADDAMAIDVEVADARPGEHIRLRWGAGDDRTDVEWRFLEKGPMTEINVKEAGFEGDDASKMAQVVESTKGFNQVIVAAKALIEHDVSVNVVEAHVPT
jgi:uncharacterized protein YndB with AHSA1/START domain